MPKTKLHGTGARHRVIPAGEEIVGAHLAATAPDFTKSTGLTEPPDEDQGQGSSCTSQAFGYHFWQLTGCQILRNDTYSHTFLPGGGAYLTAPADFVSAYGALLRSAKYQEPNPETEANMEHIVLALDAQGRMRTFQVSRVTLQASINTIASLLEQYKGIVIGVDGNDTGWTNITDPTYNGDAEWGHALYVYDRAVRNGQNALKAKSSWCNEVKNHYISDSYFNAGGVFEAIAITVKEITTMQLVKDGHTTYLVASDKSFKIGIGDTGALAMFGDESVTEGSTTGVPQTGTLATGVIFHK
jgi:hypothetical protein